VRVDRQRRAAEREIEFYQSEISAYCWRLYGGLQNPWKLRDILDYRDRATAAKQTVVEYREQITSLQPVRTTPKLKYAFVYFGFSLIASMYSFIDDS